MYIQPNTDIRILQNCPLDTTYKHTIYFTSYSEQETYFKSLTKYNLTEQTYQRVTNGKMRVAVKPELLYNCNYLMFKNSAFGDKWFYAFINSVEYVNNVTSLVEFEIDVMQTWFFEFKLGMCFVEREHSETDNVGENLVDEKLNFGEYVYENHTTFEVNDLTLENLSVVIMYNPAIFDPVASLESAKDLVYTENLYSGVYQGVRFLAIPAVRENVKLIGPIISATDFLNSGGFISAFIMPTMFLPDRTEGAWDGTEFNKMVGAEVSRPTRFGGYTPKNNKLFTYPYTSAYLTSMRGAGNDFAFEHFQTGDGRATFFAEGMLSANPSVIAYPFGYKGVAQYLEGAVSISNYPICTWGSSGVTEWLNNNLFSSLINIGGSAVKMIGSSGASAVSGDTPTSTAINSAIGLVKSPFEPGNVHGGVTGDILIGNIYGRNIHIMIKRITEEYAKVIDEYFSMYGYATNRVKIPNRSSRPYWNYVKTIGCTNVGSIPSENGGYTLTTSIPSSDMKKICSVYDNGITFWKKGEYVGNYSLDNSVKVV